MDNMSARKFIGSYAHYVLLSALAVVLAVAFGPAPYWIWPA
jgi:hypothetical protein